MFELFNEDCSILDYSQFSKNHTDFKHLIKDCVVILPDGKTLPMKSNKLGTGLDFSGMFIGSKATLGNNKLIKINY